MSNETLQYALRYAKKGLPVFPVARKGKGPCHDEIDSWTREATTDKKQIRRWFDQPDPPNVGIAMGDWNGKGGVFAVDIDVGETDGHQTWKDRLAVEEEPVPETFTVDTPSGGTHLYFLAPPGVQIKSANGALGDSIDVKGNGGYVVAPPSTTEEGIYTVREDTPSEIAPAPFWLVSAVSKEGGDREDKSPKPSAPTVSFSDNPDEKVVEEALQAIPPQPDYGKWIKIIAAVKDAVDSDRQAARLLERWSPEDSHGDYTYEERLRNAPDEQITVGTLFYYAEQEGWTPPWDRTGSPRGDGRAGNPPHPGDPSPRADSDRGLDDEEASSEPSLEPESADLREAIRSLYEDDKKRARVEVSDLLIEEFSLATHRESKHLHWWDEENHIYTRGGKEVVWSWLAEKLGKYFSKHELREIVTRIKGLTYPSEFGVEGFVSVANGDLKVTEDGVDLMEPTPERGVRNRSEAEWHPDADAPHFRDFLVSVVPREVDRKTLQEYVGYALMHWDLPLHKALFIVGPQASGKSTFLDVVCHVLGKITRLSPQQLVERRFGAAELEDSWANVSSDIPTALLSNVGRFKEITAGDQIHVERKFEQGYTIRPTTKHLYSANQLPEIKIDDDAFFRRVLIVPVPRTVPKEERIRSLADKLKQEADGILQWAVGGLMRLLKNGEFTGDLSPSETRRLWEEHASSIGKFKVRCLNVTGRDGDAVAKEDLYSTYGKFCIENGLAAESQQKLTRVLKRDPKIGDADRTPPGWDQQTSCYTGVQVSEGEKEAPK